MNLENTVERMRSKRAIMVTATIETIKSTDIWKEHANASNEVPKKIRAKVIENALISLGWDTSHKVYPKRTGMFVVRDSHDKTKAIRTFGYTFPVKVTHKYAQYYRDLDILHFGESNSKTTQINLAEFGLEYFHPTPRAKKNTNQ